MEEFRKTLSTPQKLLSQYTYMYKETEITLDSKGKPKKTETNLLTSSMEQKTGKHTSGEFRRMARR